MLPFEIPLLSSPYVCNAAWQWGFGLSSLRVEYLSFKGCCALRVVLQGKSSGMGDK